MSTRWQIYLLVVNFSVKKVLKFWRQILSLPGETDRNILQPENPPRSSLSKTPHSITTNFRGRFCANFFWENTQIHKGSRARVRFRNRFAGHMWIAPFSARVANAILDKKGTLYMWNMFVLNSECTAVTANANMNSDAPWRLNSLANFSHHLKQKAVS